jgi:hypothetical protein
LKKQEIERKRQLVQQRRENIQMIKQKFQEERQVQMKEYWEIFSAFKVKLNADNEKDAENR